MKSASKKQLERTNRDEKTSEEKDDQSIISGLQKKDDLMEQEVSKGKSELEDGEIQDDDDVNK